VLIWKARKEQSRFWTPNVMKTLKRRCSQVLASVQNGDPERGRFRGCTSHMLHGHPSKRDRRYVADFPHTGECRSMTDTPRYGRTRDRNAQRRTPRTIHRVRTSRITDLLRNEMSQLFARGASATRIGLHKLVNGETTVRGVLLWPRHRIYR
jgi:hypothetical protein